MVSKCAPSLPSINLASENLKTGTSQWRIICNNIRKALEQYGCFEVVYDEVSQDLHNDVFEVIQPLFELNPEVKARNTSDLPYHGYYKPLEYMPLLESFGIENASRYDGVQHFTHLLWPHGNEQFCEIVHQYTKKVTELEQLITKMIFESYGVEKYLDSHLRSSSYLLRIAKYNATQNNGEEKIGAVAHTDKNFITILHQNEVDGLEIQTKDGVWITYNFSCNSFVVMTGEPFLAWSNNRIHAPIHRVVMKGNKPRYSMALFSTIKDIVETPKELTDEEHPLLFKPFTYMGLLQFYTEDVSRMGVCTIKDYCGV